MAEGPQSLSGRARVLFVDHSVVLRTALKEAFKQNESLEAFTSSPAIDVTLLNIAKARPRLVVIDADRPWEEVSLLMAGVRAEHPNLKLVLLTSNAAAKSQLTENGRSLGVSDCWIKSPAFRTPDADVCKYLVQQTAVAMGVKAPAVAGSPGSSGPALLKPPC